MFSYFLHSNDGPPFLGRTYHNHQIAIIRFTTPTASLLQRVGSLVDFFRVLISYKSDIYLNCTTTN